jgi:hypothetical protein
MNCPRNLTKCLKYLFFRINMDRNKSDSSEKNKISPSFSCFKIINLCYDC